MQTWGVVHFSLVSQILISLSAWNPFLISCIVTLTGRMYRFSYLSSFFSAVIFLQFKSNFHILKRASDLWIIVYSRHAAVDLLKKIGKFWVHFNSLSHLSVSVHELWPSKKCWCSFPFQFNLVASDDDDDVGGAGGDVLSVVSLLKCKQWDFFIGRLINLDRLSQSLCTKLVYGGLLSLTLQSHQRKWNI